MGSFQGCALLGRISLGSLTCSLPVGSLMQKIFGSLSPSGVDSSLSTSLPRLSQWLSSSLLLWSIVCCAMQRTSIHVFNGPRETSSGSTRQCKCGSLTINYILILSPDSESMNVLTLLTVASFAALLSPIDITLGDD